MIDGSHLDWVVLIQIGASICFFVILVFSYLEEKADPSIKQPDLNTLGGQYLMVMGTLNGLAVISERLVSAHPSAFPLAFLGLVAINIVIVWKLDGLSREKGKKGWRLAGAFYLGVITFLLALGHPFTMSKPGNVAGFWLVSALGVAGYLWCIYLLIFRREKRLQAFWIGGGVTLFGLWLAGTFYLSTLLN